MVFGPVRSRPSCAVYLSGCLLEVVPSCRYLGVVFTPSLRWDAHLAHILAHGHRLFAQSTSWDRSEGLLASFSPFLLSTYVLPSPTFGTEFVDDCTRSIAQLDLAQRRWCRHLFGWASGTPCASVFHEHSLTASACPLAEPQPCLAVLILSLQVCAFFFLLQCLLSRRTPQLPGLTGVSLFSKTTLQGILQILLSATLLFIGHPPMVASRCLSPLGLSMVSSSPSRPRRPLWSASTLGLSVLAR